MGSLSERATDEGVYNMDNWEIALHERIRAAQNDLRTANELISLALAEPDEDVAWESVVILHLRGSWEVFEAARSLCQSDCVVEKTLGVNILGQLGVPDRTFPNECVDVLLPLLRSEVDVGVLQATCFALGHTSDKRAADELTKLATHPSDLIRYGVAFAIANLQNQIAIDTLIQLTTDTVVEVRDWATFGLGNQIESNNPEIRSALLHATTDANEVVRGEAFMGLARRRDERVMEPLIRELSVWHSLEHNDYVLDAAAELADARLLPMLLQLQESLDSQDERLHNAIQRCSQGE